MGQYGFSRRVDLPVAEAQERIEAELAREGFGVLARIDIQERLKEKLGIAFPPYTIVEVCNPPFARQSLELEMELGLLLPCNVIVYEVRGETRVAVVKPTTMLSVVGNAALDDIAGEIEARLKRALDRI